MDDPPLFDAVAVMLSLALTGTILAGVVFPVVLGVCLLLTGSAPPWMADGGYFFAYALFGGMVGGMLVLFVSMPVVALAVVIAWLSGVSGRDIWFASLVGGWTGFFATHMILDALPEQSDGWLIIPLAVIVGQCGAGGHVLFARRKGRGLESNAGEPMQFGLRQLFGVTTAVAILAAASLLLKESHRIFATLDDAAITQAGVIAAALAVKWWRERAPMRRVTRETTAVAPRREACPDRFP